MLRIIADRALLPTGWADRVALEIADDGSLSEVRPEADLRGAERVGGIVLPGLPNLHSHAFQRGMAGLAERGSARPDTFWSWRKRMYRFLGRLRPEHVEAIAAQLYVEMLEAGYTSVAEFHYLHHAPGGRAYDDPATISLRLLEAAERAGIGLTLLPTLYTSGGFGGAPPTPGQHRFLLGPEPLLELISRLGPRVRPHPRFRLGAAIHSLRAATLDEIGATVEGLEAIEPEAPIHIHAGEQEREVEACLAWSGARPVAWILDHLPVSSHWCLVHCTHVEGREVRALAESDVVVGLCPTTEANLGDGVFPLADFLALQGRFGVGSDSHVSVSPTEELRWLEYGQRLTRRERNVAAGRRDASTGTTLYNEALQGGGQAVAQGVGALAPGLRADLVVLDPEHPTLMGREKDTLLDAWIFSGNQSPVTHVMVGGEWVVREGRHLRRDEVRAAYRDTIRRLS